MPSRGQRPARIHPVIKAYGRLQTEPQAWAFADVFAAMVRIAAVAQCCNAICAETSESSTQKLRHCARCRLMRYCSGACQKVAWKYHKPVCTDIDTLHKKVMPKFCDSREVEDFGSPGQCLEMATEPLPFCHFVNAGMAGKWLRRPTSIYAGPSQDLGSALRVNEPSGGVQDTPNIFVHPVAIGPGLIAGAGPTRLILALFHLQNFVSIRIMNASWTGSRQISPHELRRSGVRRVQPLPKTLSIWPSIQKAAGLITRMALYSRGKLEPVSTSTLAEFDPRPDAPHALSCPIEFGTRLRASEAGEQFPDHLVTEIVKTQTVRNHCYLTSRVRRRVKPPAMLR
ncbi:hypothetical protein B0H15DRAFT_958003 [Mycena belliarum]|uniref:MYND-type domain-containing protein n=1 Tax=Mycena belliarum TaxID=1033014 RepID=A0AAD6XG21_9AGAR|nr:hypothetical protein B0H15DRAFT_958003 [Mycena belliae]